MEENIEKVESEFENNASADIGLEEIFEQLQNLENIQSMNEELENTIELEKIGKETGRISEEHIQTITLEGSDLDSISGTIDGYFINKDDLNISSASAPSREFIPNPPCTPIELSLHSEKDKFTSSRLEQVDRSRELPQSDELEESQAGVAKGSKSEKTKHDDVSLLTERNQKDECTSYSGVENIANIFVGGIIDSSINQVIDGRKQLGAIVNVECHVYQSISGVKTQNDENVLKWPRISDFTTEIGKNSINAYIMTWKYNEDWLYCINFLLVQSDECSDFYMYEVKWSIPSKPYPIPQATASVYFTIEVSRIKPQFCPVDVTYVFEGSSFVQAPGQVEFDESFLFDIIDVKLALYKSIRF